jgi:ribonuclease HI
MGFRDLSVFNQALLAKQCWQLWTSPDSLTAQIFKSKYYPNCSILEAQLGTKPSFSWRSIQGACKIVSDGLIWRIGEGSKVKIWGDRWIHNPTTYMIQSPPTILVEEAKVEELIDHDRKGCNVELLDALFNEDDWMAIKGIPISSSSQPNKLVWRGTKNGVFSVSSAYHMMKEVEIENQPKSSIRRGQTDLWKGIWNMRSPNVVKNFMWRACRNLLPTKENLMRKKVFDEPLCPICMLEAETTFHAIWDCSASRDVWGASLRIFQKSTFPGSDFSQVTRAFLEKGGAENFRLFSEIARRIWLRRNGWIFDGQFSHPNNLVQVAEAALIEYEQATKHEERRDGALLECTAPWMKPDCGWAKVNVDAAFDKGGRKMGFGIIIRDQEGKFLAAKSAIRMGRWELAAAEALATYLGVLLGQEMGVQQMILEGDAKQVTEAIRAKEGNDSMIGHLINDVRQCLKNIPRWQVNHVFREANRVAHELAKHALKQANDIVWVDECPSCIRDILLTEQLLRQ